MMMVVMMTSVSTPLFDCKCLVQGDNVFTFVCLLACLRLKKIN